MAHEATRTLRSGKDAVGLRRASPAQRQTSPGARAIACRASRLLACGSTAWTARTRAELRAAGEAIPDTQESDLGLLTPQELQIALAVANGLTNREVAASLFLSPKTVEYHLGNVYSKLALRSRTDLVRLIAAQA